MIDLFFEQFKGDIEYVDPWHDPRAVRIFKTIDVSAIHFQSMSCDRYGDPDKYQINWVSDLSHADMEKLLRKTNNNHRFNCERTTLAWEPGKNFLNFYVKFLDEDRWVIL